MVKKVEAFKAWDGTVHATMENALQYEFEKLMERMFEVVDEVGLTGPQLSIIWKNRAAVYRALGVHIVELDGVLSNG